MIDRKFGWLNIEKDEQACEGLFDQRLLGSVNGVEMKLGDNYSLI